jgi:hypothetical protein
MTLLRAHSLTCQHTGTGKRIGLSILILSEEKIAELLKFGEDEDISEEGSAVR